MSSQDQYRIPGTEPPEPRQLAEHASVEGRAKKALIIAVVSVGIAIVASFFGFLQWKAADRQADIADRALKLAKRTADDQSADIERSRKAAEESAASAQVLAQSNASMAETMKGQQRTMQAQLELQERPWIKVTDVQTRGNDPVVPALSFQNSVGYQQATFQLKVSVKNIGHSVAEIAVRYDLFLPLWENFDTSVTNKEKSFCDSEMGSARAGYYPSRILFPDETFDWYGAAAQIVSESNVNRSPTSGDAKWIIPVVIVCANYRLKSLPSNYQSRAVYEVFRKDNRTRFFEPGVGMPADKIFLLRNDLKDFAY
jgi:hypothetical protein